MHLRAVVAALLLSGCLSECHAQGTQLWKETKAEDFEKGTGHGVAIRSDGMLSLSPASSAVATLPSTYIWDAAFANGRILASNDYFTIARSDDAGFVARLYAAGALLVLDAEQAGGCSGLPQKRFATRL